MRGLTIHQPSANFIADGDKQYETRSWRTSYTGLIAIHASKNHEETEYSGIALDGPFGAIVAVCRLKGCIPTETMLQVESGDLNLHPNWPPITEAERYVGNWSPGRWAWALTDVVKLSQPVPLRGYQGLWNVPRDIATILESGAR